MLPSTFATKHQKEDKQKKIIRMRLELGASLKNIHSKYLERIDDEAQRTIVKNILGKFRRNQAISTEEIQTIAPYFRDHITLDSLTTSQLNNLCHYMHINAIGSDVMLRGRLRRAIQHIRREDAGIIETGGVDKLQNYEVVQLIQERGMRVDNTMFDLRRDLANWIELTQSKKMPTSLLLLSRTLMVSAGAKDATEQIASVLKDVPDAIEEVLVDSLDEEDPELKQKTADRQTRIIKEEKEERKKVVEKPAEDLKAEQDAKDLSEKQKLVEFVKIVTDGTAVAQEKEMLQTMRNQVEAAKGRLDRSDDYLKVWETILGREELNAKSKISREEVKIIWKANELGFWDLDEHFERWDSNRDDHLSAKRTWLLLDEALQMKSETISVKYRDVVSEVREETEEDEEERKNIKKTASKISGHLQKMFDKLEKDISKSEAKIAGSLKQLPVELCTPEKIKEIIEQEYESDAPPHLVEEILKRFTANDTPEQIKEKIEKQVHDWSHEKYEEELEEMDVSDLEDEEIEKELQKGKTGESEIKSSKSK